MFGGILPGGRIKSFILVFGLVILGLDGFGQGVTAATTWTYTLDADFDGGVLVGVEHETVPDQLQLSQELVTLPFIWVPNYQGTVSKVDTLTGRELGRYRVAPHSWCDPSRTTVDLDGNCYVGNRKAGTVVKIGLYEAGQCVDRNGDGIIQTSQDLNNDGDITGAELRPWGEDECVLYEVVLIPGKEGPYVPGTYTGGYDEDYWGTAPRGLAVDRSNNLWAGTWESRKYYYIDGSTGEILKTVDTNSCAYGAVIDANGVLWSARQNYADALRLDPSTEPPGLSWLYFGHVVYGLGLDHRGHLFVSSWSNSVLSKVDVSTPEGTILWTKYDDAHLYGGRGVTCTSDNDVWVASTYRKSVSRFDNEGNWKASIDVGAGPTGVAVDAAGKVWVCSLDDQTIKRIDPDTNTVDLSKTIVDSIGHYTYSDMTGIVARTVTTKIGTWTVDFDSGQPGIPWGTISWNSQEPAGTSITVQARSSNDLSGWSTWESAINAVPLSSTPPGRYLQIETTLQITAGENSPILEDLTVESANEPPTADPSGPYLGAAGSPIVFDGTGSDDPDGDPLTYDWDFGDTNTGTGATPSHTYSDAAIYDVCLIVYDGIEDSEQVCTLAVVYDPSAGFVTGGGWIDSPSGAYMPDPLLTGKATFGFVAKYKKDSTEPVGKTEFQFHVADLNFHSSSCEWLVVAGAKAMYKGIGSINSEGEYKFMLKAIDADINEDDSFDVDRFRIKIWHEIDNTEYVIYDNALGDDDDMATTEIGGGSIIIHAK